jgi:hypothetical protein
MQAAKGWLNSRKAKYLVGFPVLAVLAWIGIAVAKTVTQPMDFQLRTQVKFMEQNPQGKWVPVDQLPPTDVRFEATLLEVAAGQTVTSAFVLDTTTTKGKRFRSRLLGEANVDFNPVTGQLDARMTFEVEYDGEVVPVHAVITTEARNTPDGQIRGVRADNLFGRKPATATVVSANPMTLPDGRNLLLICKDTYTVKPRGLKASGPAS